MLPNTTIKPQMTKPFNILFSCKILKVIQWKKFKFVELLNKMLLKIKTNFNKFVFFSSRVALILRIAINATNRSVLILANECLV